MSKLFDVHAEIERQAKRERRQTFKRLLAFVMDSFSTASVPLLDGFKATLIKITG